MNAEIERLQAIIAQQDRQITLLVDRLDKADWTVQDLRHWLRWSLRRLDEHLIVTKDWSRAHEAAWPKQD